MELIELVQVIQRTDNQAAWQDILSQLEPIVNRYARLAPMSRREDLRQELRLEIVKAIRNFKIYKKIS